MRAEGKYGGMDNNAAAPADEQTAHGQSAPASEPKTHRALIAVQGDLGEHRSAFDLGDLKTDHYMDNPVVFWEHGIGGNHLPIAKTTGLELTGEGWMAEFQFAQDADDDLVRQIESRWEQGILNATSLSFDADTHDLVEWSIVGVPADPLALSKRSYNPVSRGGTDMTDAAKPDGFDAEAMGKMISDSVTAGVKAALEAFQPAQTPADDPAPQAAGKGGEGDGGESEGGIESRSAAINEAARARAELIDQTRDLLPEGFNVHSRSIHDILVAAVGGEDAAKGKSDDYLRGEIGGMLANRARSAEQRSAFSGATRQSTGKPVQDRYPGMLAGDLSFNGHPLHDASDPAAVERRNAYGDWCKNISEAWRGAPASSEKGS